MKSIDVALQLYSVREDCSKDFPDVLKRVAGMGYDGVEFAGFYERSAAEIRNLLDACGLRCAGSHTPLAHLDDDVFDATVQFNKDIGNRFIVVPGLPKERTESIAAWEGTADLFNRLAERLAPHGMRLGYHNHFTEFAPIDGIRPWDLFFSRTQDVVMQLDTGNARHGGADPVAILKQYPGRAETVHLKEWTDDPAGAVVGDGKLDWNEIFSTCESIGKTEWYIVEQETYPVPPMEAVERCVANIHALQEKRQG